MSENAGATTFRVFPHSYRMLTVQGIYRRLTLAILVPLGFGIFRGGPDALVMVIAAVAGAILADFLATRFVTSVPFDSAGFRAVYFGLAVAALLSPQTSPLVAAFAAALSVIVGIWFFGGPGRYRVHPALVGPALLGMALPGMQALREGGTARAIPLPAEFIAWMEQVILEPLGVRVTADAWALLLGAVGPEGGSLVMGLIGPILLGSLILFGEDLLPPVLPFSFLLAYAVLVRLFGGNPLDAVFLTNAPFVMLFLLADPPVRPATHTGMALFGVFAGALGALFWITGEIALPAVTALFLAGTFVAVVDSLTTRRL